ncbi:MAG: hypothetical protein LUC88_06370 [Prevotella sp.]|nr:hypothetical protein [Prevotella sp.]
MGVIPTSTPQEKAIVKVIANSLFSLKEIMELMALKDRKSFLDSYLNPAIESGFIELLYPESPKHPKQKYRLTDTKERCTFNIEVQHPRLPPTSLERSGKDVGGRRKNLFSAPGVTGNTKKQKGRPPSPED